MTASMKLGEATASSPSMKLTILELCSSREWEGEVPLSILEICGDSWGCHDDGGELLLEFDARHPTEHGPLLYKRKNSYVLYQFLTSHWTFMQVESLFTID